MQIKIQQNNDYPAAELLLKPTTYGAMSLEQTGTLQTNSDQNREIKIIVACFISVITFVALKLLMMTDNNN